MTENAGYVALPGSERKAPDASRIGPADPDERVEVSVYLRPPGDAPPVAGRIGRAGYAAVHGARAEDLGAVEQFGRDHGLEVVESSRERRRVVLAGTVAAVSAAFDVELHRYQATGGTFRGRIGYLRVPADLAAIITAVLGLDERPAARPHFTIREGPELAAAQSFTPPQLARLYAYPTAGDGSGQCVGIIELGGGYREGDLTAYFAGLGLPVPTVVSVPVDGADNSPTGDPNSADGEVALDIEVAGALAPGARIAVYFAPNTDRGFVDAITAAIFDNTNRPSVISISWGAAEADWMAQSVQAMDQAFESAASVGVTACCASGDDGSRDGVNDSLAHVDFPASSPHVLGCGGTRLTATGNAIDTEITWSPTGGGVSDRFALPDWQDGAGVPPSANPGGRVGRGVPDVAGDADPATGYQVLVDGQSLVFGGTSAVAPLWAGLLALVNQQRAEPVGFLNPLLYRQAVAEPAVVGDITVGSNGAYRAGTGWDACTGLGSPRGEALLTALTG